jgi:hypothetical protein
VLIAGNSFYDNRKVDGNRDHSTVNIFADNTRVIGNRFALPVTATDLQKQIVSACELHGSASCFNHNTLSYYVGSVIFSENLHHDCLSQEAVGNVLSNHGYRGFDLSISGQFKTVKQINIGGNAVHFGTVVGVTNQTLPFAVPVPFPKWGVSFWVGPPAVLDSLNVTGNTFDGDTLNQAGQVVGIAGLWGGSGYSGLTHLNVAGNTFRRLAYGVWQDGRILTVAKHSTITGNRFEDLADPTTDPEPGNPIYRPPAGSARGVYVTSDGGPDGIMSVSAAANSFVNEWDHPTYQYGFYFRGTVFRPSVGENWYYLMKTAELAFDQLSAATVVSLPPLANRAVVDAPYRSHVVIDPGLGGRFVVRVSNGMSFSIGAPRIAATQATFVDGTEIEITIRNASDGALGDVAWDTGDPQIFRLNWNSPAISSNDDPKDAGAPLPVPPGMGEQQPEQSISIAEWGPRDRAPEHRQLMAEREVLKRDCAVSAADQCKRSEHYDMRRQHELSCRATDHRINGLVGDLILAKHRRRP